jgi:hypothetical protein
VVLEFDFFQLRQAAVCAAHYLMGAAVRMSMTGAVRLVAGLSICASALVEEDFGDFVDEETASVLVVAS